MKTFGRLVYVVLSLSIFVTLALLAGRQDANAPKNSKTFATVRIGDQIHTVTYGGAQIGFIDELQPLVSEGGRGGVVGGILIAKIRIGTSSPTNDALERIAFVPSSEKVKLHDRVVVYRLTHLDGYSGRYNHTTMVKAIPDDYHGF